MSQSREFCPRCGEAVTPRASDPGESDAGLCEDCYFESFELVDAPERLQVTFCSRCGAVQRGKRWLDVGADDYTDIAIDEVSEALAVHVDAEDVEWGVEPEQVDATTIRMHCTVAGVVRGRPREAQFVVPVRLSKAVCDRCGRIAGGYFASIVQVRAEEREPTAAEAATAVEIAESYVAACEADGDREAFITEVDTESDAGPNIKLSTNKLGQAVATRITNHFGGTVEDHPTLVTEDSDGNEVYRVTFVARLPKYTAGDVVDPGDSEGPVLVTSGHGTLTGRRLRSGERYRAAREDGTTPDVDLLGRREDAVETTVVTVEDDHAVQLLDPDSYEAKTVARPDFLDAEDDTVEVLKHADEIYVVPPEDEHAS